MVLPSRSTSLLVVDDVALHGEIVVVADLGVDAHARRSAVDHHGGRPQRDDPAVAELVLTRDASAPGVPLTRPR